MKAVILAAGQGTRLRPLTDDRPKCLVPVQGRPLLDRQIDVLRAGGVHDITVVGGYRADALRARHPDVNHAFNPAYDATNMVASMLCADVFDGSGDVLICYGDIVYTPEVLATVLGSGGDIGLGIDLDWLRLWSIRGEDPLDDAETLRIENGAVREVGAKPTSMDQMDGQYMGLFKVQASAAAAFAQAYADAPASEVFRGRARDDWFMTDHLQRLIDQGWDVQAATVHGGWLEVDTPGDLALYDADADGMFAWLQDQK